MTMSLYKNWLFWHFIIFSSYVEACPSHRIRWPGDSYSWEHYTFGR